WFSGDGVESESDGGYDVMDFSFAGEVSGPLDFSLPGKSRCPPGTSFPGRSPQKFPRKKQHMKTARPDRGGRSSVYSKGLLTGVGRLPDRRLLADLDPAPLLLAV